MSSNSTYLIINEFPEPSAEDAEARLRLPTFGIVFTSEQVYDNFAPSWTHSLRSTSLELCARKLMQYFNFYHAVILVV